MGNFFCRLFAPWKAEGCFDELDDFYDFLLRHAGAGRFSSGSLSCATPGFMVY